MDVRGIVQYLLCTYLITGALAFLGHVTDFGTSAELVLYSVLLQVPFAVARYIGSRNLDYPIPAWGFRGLARRRVLLLVLLIPIVFIILYVITGILEWGAADWRVSRAFVGLSRRNLVISSTAVSRLVVPLFFVASVALGPTLYAAACLGHEIGWRGFLLARLAPLGPRAAALLTALCWAPWAALFLFRTLDRGPYAGARTFCMAFALGIILGLLKRPKARVGVCAVFLGCILSQFFGLWPFLFPHMDSPWGGSVGWFAVVLWGLIAVLMAVVRGPSDQS
jgi:CAAX prenyl protease-like protein